VVAAAPGIAPVGIVRASVARENKKVTYKDKVTDKDDLCWAIMIG
jgi:hypothetical protein